jgi:hypothetical protein
MTTLNAALRALFTGDATFMALATGGVHDPETLGRQELEIDDIRQPGTPLINPALFIRWTTDAPFGEAVVNAHRHFVELYFFQDTGYAVTASMRQRAYALLHRQRVTFDEPASDYVFEFRWAGDIVQQQDESLGGASMERSRYYANSIR